MNRPIVTGTSGGTKLRPVRRAMDDQDTIVVMLNPMGGFAGVSDALDGEQLTWVMTFYGAVFEHVADDPLGATEPDAPAGDPGGLPAAGHHSRRSFGGRFVVMFLTCRD